MNIVSAMEIPSRSCSVASFSAALRLPAVSRVEMAIRTEGWRAVRRIVNSSQGNNAECAKKKRARGESRARRNRRTRVLWSAMSAFQPLRSPLLAELQRDQATHGIGIGHIEAEGTQHI